jgi:hypothetical protein
MTTITGTLRKEQYTVLNICLSDLLRMRYFQTYLYRKIRSTYFIFSNTFVEKRAFYGIMCNSIEYPDSP